MTPAELIAAIRQSNADIIPDVFVALYKFSPVEREGRPYDDNLHYRSTLVEELYCDFSLKDIHLIRSLLHEEMKFDDAFGEHHNILQLCYYLYELAQVEDVFVIYDCKYNTGTMDVGCIMDREMLMLRHNVDEVIQYVKDRFEKDPSLKEKYEDLMSHLENLGREYDTSDAIEGYTQSIRDYIDGNRNGLSLFDDSSL